MCATASTWKRLSAWSSASSRVRRSASIYPALSMPRPLSWHAASGSKKRSFARDCTGSSKQDYFSNNVQSRGHNWWNAGTATNPPWAVPDYSAVDQRGAHMSAENTPSRTLPDNAAERAANRSDTARLEAFSDGVFAIAITLLVLNIRVPLASQLKGQTLLEALLQQWPAYLAYVVSFVTILLMWVGHHNMFTYIHR